MSPRAKAIPEGHHAITPSLIVRGAADAIEFYKKAFGAEERERFSMPGSNRIMHAELKIGDSFVMLSEECAETGCLSPSTLKGSPATLYLYVEDVDSVFSRAVQAGGQIKMPVADMFWGDRMGQLTDPSGHVWSIATHKEDLAQDQISKRAQEFFKDFAKAGK